MRKYPVVAIYRRDREGRTVGQLRSGRLGTGTVLFTHVDEGGENGSEARIACALGTAARKLGVRIAGATRIYPSRSDVGNPGRAE